METRLLIRVESQTSFLQISLYGSVSLYQHKNIQGERLWLWGRMGAGSACLYQEGTPPPEGLACLILVPAFQHLLSSSPPDLPRSIDRPD